MPFIDRLHLWARSHPARDAVVTEDRRLTYGELADRAACSKVPERPMISLTADDPVDFVIAFTAVVGSGRCAAVLDPEWPRDLRTRVLEALGSDAVVRTAGGDGTAGGTAVTLADGHSDSRFYCGFTSGTSGLPKGFVRTVGSWSRSLHRSVAFFGVTPGLRVFAPGPLAASLNLYALAECLYSGATFHTVTPGNAASKAARMTTMLRSERIQHLVAVPAAVRLALEHADGGLPHLGTVVSGGAKLSEAETGMIRRVAPHARIFEYYGASELSVVTARRVTSPGSDVGRPFPGVQIRIDADHGSREGTVYVRTDTAIEGYLFGDDGNAFQRHGEWMTVQDRGWIDDDGALHLTGRHGDMAVVAGVNVYPSEVERALASIGFPAAVVLGLPDPRRGSVLAAVLEASPQESIGLLSLRSRLRDVLPAEKIPVSVFRTPSLPLTAAGKPDRAGLRAALLAGGGDLGRIS